MTEALQLAGYYEGDTRGPWIHTFREKQFHFQDPRPDEIDILDIANALSKQCRFAGHTNEFYSVAEHSVYVSYMTAQDPLQGLLHDASEAYLVDMPSPIKKAMSQYGAVEETIMQAISKKFGFEWPKSEDCEDADKAQLIEEAKALLNNPTWVNEEKYKPLKRKFGIVPMCLAPNDARTLFMERFKQVRNKVAM